MKYHIISKILKTFAGGKAPAFSNIAEGTHAGSITLKAAEDINSAHLLVKLDDTGNEIQVCSATDLPVGVCPDESDMGDSVAVNLSGSAESTFTCRAATDIDAGDELYTAAGGKVTAVASPSCYKVGVALTSAPAGSVVEVDTQGFGTRAFQVAECGVYVWKGATKEETLEVDGAKTGDFVAAAFAAVGASEKTVCATADENSVKFKLDANGTANTTKISWIIIKK